MQRKEIDLFHLSIFPLIYIYIYSRLSSVSLMSATNQFMFNHTRPETTNQCPYFVFVLTNYPNLIQRTRQYQRPYQVK